jgi:hypothetical protein
MKAARFRHLGIFILNNLINQAKLHHVPKNPAGDIVPKG